MIKNYLKGAFRSLSNEKTNTLINLAGLTLGITGSLILFLFIWDGSSYDRYHEKSERIYRIVSQAKGNTGETFTEGVPTVLPEAFRSDFPEAEEVIFTSYRRNNLIAVAQANGEFKKYEEPKGVVFTQPGFFRIFDRPILFGSAEAGLDQPNEAIISRKWALKYFQKVDVRGEIVKYEDKEYKITAVVEDYPSNTDLPFDLLLSYTTIKRELDGHGWGSVSDETNCYFLLKENVSISQIEDRLPAFVKKYYGEDDQNKGKNTHLIQPLHTLHSDMRFGNYNSKMPMEAKIAFIVIGIFLLVTCCINFINLTTAAAIKRTREVGIRKVLGSSRGQLLFRLVGEAFLVTLFSGILSIVCAHIFIGYLNSFLDITLSLRLGSDPVVWLYLLVVIFTVTLLSGLYPALVVSSYKPALALKNKINKSTSSYSLRKGLVVLQFFISQFFIIATLVIFKQFDYLQQQDIGFAQDAIVIIPIPPGGNTGEEGHSRIRTLKNEIMRLPGIEAASLNSAPPYSGRVGTSSFTIPGHEEQINAQIKEVDGDYIDLYQLKLVAGEYLPDMDSIGGFVVNETLVKMAGFAGNSDIVGTELSLWGNQYPVKGVVKDFNTTSLEKAIEPVILLNNIDAFHSLSIKLNPSYMQASLKQVQKNWEVTFPEYIFSYRFLDDQVKSMYDGERKTSILLGIFASIAIFIGCLGLFGLVTFMANQKTKEIGVRKVLGASVESILMLFSKELVKLILIGFLMAGPIAGLVMHKILQEFAYKITLGPAIFLTGIGVTFLIAFLTVGFRSIQTALVNPVESLRSE